VLPMLEFGVDVIWVEVGEFGIAPGHEGVVLVF
jgi:hypothetical protein